VLITGNLALLQSCGICGADAAAVASMAQLAGSEDYVVVCATLGEVGENNPDNWIRPNGGPDPTTNITVRRWRAGTGLLAGTAAGQAADPPADHRARGVVVVDRGGSGHVRRRAGLSAAWGQECLRHGRRVVPDVRVVESDTHDVRAGAGSGGETELTATGAVADCQRGPRLIAPIAMKICLAKCQ
jgi:hypothetical protein